MSKMGNFVLEVEEYVQQFVDAKVDDNRILNYVKATYGSFGMGVAQDYLDRVNGVEYDYSPF
jgi:hypothetical protein